MKKLIFGVMFGLLMSSFVSVCAVADPSAGPTVRFSTNEVTMSASGDFFLDAAVGLIEDVTTINKFGRSPLGLQTTATDIWDRANATPTQQVWVAPTQARLHNIASSHASDDAVGTGTQTLKLYGLTDWDTPETSEIIVMDGTSNVSTARPYVMINRMKVLTTGTSVNGANVGNITATAATDGTVTAQINAAEGQTQMAIYGLSSLDKMYIGRFYGNAVQVAGGDEAVMKMLVNEEPDSQLLNFRTNHTFGIRGGGTSALTINYYVPKVINGPAIVKIQGIGDSSDMDVSAGWDGIIHTDTSTFNAIVTTSRRRNSAYRGITTSDGVVIRTTQ